MFSSILNGGLTLTSFLICIISSIILGMIVAVVHMKTNKSNQSFIESLVILPVLVTVVILLVNGNLGTSVAIAGAFSLIRFRSIPGNAKEIVNVFLVMVIGVTIGTGYIGFACIFTFIICFMLIILYLIKFGNCDNDKILKISVPEDLDYEKIFDDVFDKYLKKYELKQSKTINMGSIFELIYIINMKDDISEKSFIDDLRVKNGNLKIVLTHEFENREAL